MYKMFLRNLNIRIAEKTGLGIVQILPRRATRWAKDHFKGKEVVCAEIGTFKGEHAKSILKNLNVKRIYLIDPYSSYKEYEEKLDLNKAEKEAEKRLSKYKDKIIWIKEPSSKAISKIKEKLDFLYVDGNHSYGYVKKDLELYSAIVRPGGIMAGHDTPLPGVMKAVAEFSNEHPKYKLICEQRDFCFFKV